MTNSKTVSTTLKNVFLILGLALGACAHAQQPDGRLFDFENGSPFFGPGETGDIVDALPGYEGGRFLLFDFSLANLRLLDAVSSTDGLVRVGFDLLIIGDWLGEGQNGYRLVIRDDSTNTVLLEETFSNVNFNDFFLQSYGSPDGLPVAPGTGAAAYVEREFGVYPLTFTVPDDDGFGDLSLDLQSFSGPTSPGLSFGIDNFIVSGRPLDQDTDADGIVDNLDNCNVVANPDQRDTDGDQFGNRCDPDLNNDCSVNVEDLGLLRSVFFTADSAADLNGDNTVNFVDLGIMRSYFFGLPGPARIGSYPGCGF